MLYNYAFIVSYSLCNLKYFESRLSCADDSVVFPCWICQNLVGVKHSNML